jgi:hypothetical protein
MPAVEQQPDTTSKHYLLPPDICLTFTGDDYPARQAIEFMFDFCRPLDGPGKPCAQQVTARITINNDYLSSPLPGWIDKQIADRREYDHVHAFYGPDGEAAALLSNRDGFVCGLLNKGADRIDLTLGKTGSMPSLMMSPSAIFTPLIQEVLQRRRHLLFHSAGLRLQDGTGSMILADSGGGKTTTALALLRKGASMLADDLVIYTRENSIPVIHGIPEPLNLTAATRDFFPELRTAGSLPARDGVTTKVVFDPRTVYGGNCFGAKTQLHVIYFVEVSSGRPRLAPIPPQAALGKMIKGCTFAFGQRLARTSGSSLFDLAATIPCFSLHTGSNPDFLGSWLQEKSAGIAAGVRP